MNRNLHSPTKLTEFARDFDIEPDTFLAKFVNKITNVYNSGYNTVNVVPASSPVLGIVQAAGPNANSVSQNSTPSHSSSASQTSSSASLASDQLPQQSNHPTTSEQRDDVGDPDQLSDLPRSNARTPSSVLQRISNLMAIRNNNNLTSYKNTELHQFWMPDSKSKECYDCSLKFSTFRRKHHCRLCGQIFCSKCCCQVVPGKIISCSGDLKVCTYCSKIVLTYLKSSDINSDLKSDLQALQDDLSSKLQHETTSASNLQESASPQRKVSVGYQEERLLSNPKNPLSNADRKTILQQSTSLKVLYEDICKELPNQNRGADIVTYLIRKNKSSNKPQAMAILTAMIEAGYMVEVETIGMAAKSASTAALNDMGVVPSTSELDLLHEFNENSFYKMLRPNEIMTNSGTFQLNLNVDSTSVQISRPESGSSGVDGAAQGHDSNFAISQLRELDVENSLKSTTGSKGLQEAFCRHEELLLNQLLRNEGLDESWSKILLPRCARIVNTLPPDSICAELMDIRNYVNFKKVQDGSREECCSIGGVVFTKHVVHKDMATTIDKARILLLQCPIVYQRVEGRFVRIETLLLQEREYLTNVIGRIRSLNPNVIFVHKNVSGIAQEMLRKYQISLVVDVKLSVLKRLSRCLQCDIVSSIDSNIGRPKLGICKKFYVKNYTSASGCSKTLMFVETPSIPRGYSVLLRGGNYNELVRVKRVASFLLFARYNWRLEMSFLLAEFAEPPSPKPSIFDSSPGDAMSMADAAAARTKCEEIETAKQTKKLVEKKSDDKIVQKENVQDFSDPLRAVDLPTNPSSVKFAVEQPCDNRFRTALSSTILSITPFAQFPLPYLETENGRKCALRSRFPNELYYSEQWSDGVEKNLHAESTVAKSNKIETNHPHEFLTAKIVTPAETREFQNTLASFRASGGILKKKAKSEKNDASEIGRKQKNNSNISPHIPVVTLIDRKSEQKETIQSAGSSILRDALDIHNHQRIPVLFCSFYHSPEATSSFCAHPFLLNMSFYGENDIMLGQFLERYCFCSSYICASCKLPMLDHVRRYVHSMGCVTVKLTEDLQGKNLSQILMFSWCSKCQQMTPSVAMQQDTWCLSFGKYLEMRFHSHAYRRRRLETSEKDAKMDTSNGDATTACDHSLHRDYVHYFSYNGIVASFSYTPIEVWEITLPSLTVGVESTLSIDASAHVDETKEFSARGYDVYAAIYDKLAQLSNDAEFPMLNNLKRLINTEQLQFREKVGVMQALLTEKTTDWYKLNDAFLVAKRVLSENIEKWNHQLTEAAIQSRTICANTKLEAPLPAPQPQPQQPPQPQTPPIDAGTICTEDLRPDSGEVTNFDYNEYSREMSNDSDAGKGQLDSPIGSVVTDREAKSSDKKSVKTRLRDLLPSDKHLQITLQSPLPPSEHYSLAMGHVPVLVHDQDLSSVIAYSLATFDYKKVLDNLQFCKPNDSANSTDVDEKEATAAHKENEKERKTKAHVEIVFSDTSAQFACKVYFARDFDLLRSKFLRLSDDGIGVADAQPTTRDFERMSRNNSLSANSVDSSRNDEDADDQQKQETERIRIAFARSLSKSIRWEARGGKSGSKFCKTMDDRFVLKEMSKTELVSFEEFAPNYFVYIHQCLQKNHPTLLAKIFGVFRVTIKKKDQVHEKSLLIMENLFYKCDISNKFDLKGSVRNRLVDPSNQSGEEIVLLDENLIHMSWSKPLYILSHSKTVLREAINRDATFLEKNDVMDYSLLVGLNSAGKLLVLGIIDYIRTYTIDKRIESLVKQTMGKQGILPTIISPKLYRQRFSEAMERYFLAVPDRWEGLEKNI